MKQGHLFVVASLSVSWRGKKKHRTGSHKKSQLTTRNAPTLGCHSSERTWVVLTPLAPLGWRRPLGKKQGDGCMVECPLWFGGTTSRLPFSCSLSRLSIFMVRAIKASRSEGCSVETIWSFMDQGVCGGSGRADKKYRTQWHDQGTLQVSWWRSMHECVDEDLQLDPRQGA